jgi:glycine cleavage system aminomethyltransferase T
LLWDRLWEAGRPFGLVACGRAAYDGLRMEKGYRSWGTDMTEDDDPFESGIGFTVRPLKGDFIGRDALAAKKEAGRRRALTWVGLDDPAHVVIGKEPVRAGDDVVGYVRSSAYGYCVGRHLVSVMLPVDLATPGTALTVEWFGDRLPATVLKDPIWDPAGERIRS